MSFRRVVVADGNTFATVSLPNPPKGAQPNAPVAMTGQVKSSFGAAIPSVSINLGGSSSGPVLAIRADEFAFDRNRERIPER